MVIIHSSRCLEYAATGHPESPERVRSTLTALMDHHHDWIEPVPCSAEDILRVHTPAVLDAVRTGNFFDADTPSFPNIFEFATLSAGAAIVAAEQALAGKTAFSLMRPPGHHAERNRVMGFCYFNNLAIAVAKLLATGNAQRVAILDFDCHHGNGTEQIFSGNDRVQFASIHQSPCYPGSGTATRGNCFNYPLPPGTTGPVEFLKAVDAALAQLGEFQPDVLAVSAGFDAYKHDPITEMRLEVDTYREIGERIVHWCEAWKRPCFMVLEGGYAPDFWRCVQAFVNAWW